MKILHVVGARPNFMKAAPPPVPPNFGGLGGQEMAKYPQEFEQLLAHTGQPAWRQTGTTTLYFVQDECATICRRCSLRT